MRRSRCLSVQCTKIIFHLNIRLNPNALELFGIETKSKYDTNKTAFSRYYFALQWIFEYVGCVSIVADFSLSALIYSVFGSRCVWFVYCLISVNVLTRAKA